MKDDDVEDVQMCKAKGLGEAREISTCVEPCVKKRYGFRSLIFSLWTFARS